jgi:hypothetical protein
VTAAVLAVFTVLGLAMAIGTGQLAWWLLLAGWVVVAAVALPQNVRRRRWAQQFLHRAGAAGAGTVDVTRSG